MVIVCIPIYKTLLEWYEKISLEQAISLFGNKYDICLCVPETMGTDFLNKYGCKFQIRSFPDVYFTSVKAYSELCLTTAFYQGYDKYEYMLLYQLDAFAFQDDLEYFCGLGFDYIGADTCDGIDWNLINESIGCGGFSLRKISSFMKVLIEHQDILTDHILKNVFITREDVFWGYCGHKPSIDFSIPNIELANRFAVTFGVKNLIRKNSSKSLPFGTHAWHRYDYNLWKPIIEKYGYELPECNDITFVDTEEEYLKVSEYRNIYNNINNSNGDLKKYKSCCIWGAGYNGIRCIRLLNKMGVDISHIFDWNTNALAGAEDINAPSIENPTIANINNIQSDDLLIITAKADKEIFGKVKNINYIMYSDFLIKMK